MVFGDPGWRKCIVVYRGEGRGGRWPSATICLRKYKESDGKQVVPSDAP